MNLRFEVKIARHEPCYANVCPHCVFMGTLVKYNDSRRIRYEFEPYWDIYKCESKHHGLSRKETKFIWHHGASVGLLNKPLKNHEFHPAYPEATSELKILGVKNAK